MFEKEPQNELTPVNPYLSMIESANKAYQERLSKDIPEEEKKELEQVIENNDKAAEYLISIVPRLKDDLTVEEIIEEDREKLREKAEQKIGKEISKEKAEYLYEDIDKDIANRDLILRLAETTVRINKEKQE